MVIWDSSQWLGKNTVRSTGGGKKLKENPDRCTCHRDVIEIILKMALNTIQNFKQYTNKLKSVRMIVNNLSIGRFKVNLLVSLTS